MKLRAAVSQYAYFHCNTKFTYILIYMYNVYIHRLINRFATLFLFHFKFSYLSTLLSSRRRLNQYVFSFGVAILNMYIKSFSKYQSIVIIFGYIFCLMINVFEESNENTIVFISEKFTY